MTKYTILALIVSATILAGCADDSADETEVYYQTNESAYKTQEFGHEVSKLSAFVVKENKICGVDSQAIYPIIDADVKAKSSAKTKCFTNADEENKICLTAIEQDRYVITADENLTAEQLAEKQQHDNVFNKAVLVNKSLQEIQREIIQREKKLIN